MIGASFLLFSSDWFYQPVLSTRQLPDLPLDKTYPYRANYNALYPAGESRRESLAQDIVRGIHIRVDQLPLSRDELSPLDPPPAVDRMLADGLQIQKGAFRGIFLFLDDHLDPGQLGLVGQHVDECGMGNGDEVLVVDGTNVHFLFPALIMSDDQGAEAFRYHPVHDVAAGPMQEMMNLAIALVGQSVEMVGRELPVGQGRLQIGPPFVVVGIDALERSAVNQKGGDALLV